jgi:hypothetical protein
MKMLTMGFILLFPALFGMATWSSSPDRLLLFALLLVGNPSGLFGWVYALLIPIALLSVSYYAVHRLSKRRFVRIVLSALLPLCLLVSFYGGVYLGELWAVQDAKSYLDRVVRSADAYLEKHGEYPESLNKLDLPPMPRLVRESANRTKNSAYFFVTPYQRIDNRSIEVGFGYSKGLDECASYTWSTKKPRWVCWCAGCLTDNPNG